MVREMRLAVLAAVDLVAIEIDIVGETHGPGLGAGCAVFLRDCSQRRRGTSACNVDVVQDGVSVAKAKAKAAAAGESRSK
jgi:hypothetical protein